MTTPVYYTVTQAQIGKENVLDFLRKAVAKQFESREYYVAREVIENRATPYSPTPRKLRGFMINEANTQGHIIYFDVTDVNDGAWLS